MARRLPKLARTSIKGGRRRKPTALARGGAEAGARSEREPPTPAVPTREKKRSSPSHSRREPLELPFPTLELPPDTPQACAAGSAAAWTVGSIAGAAAAADMACGGAGRGTAPLATNLPELTWSKLQLLGLQTAMRQPAIVVAIVVVAVVIVIMVFFGV